MRSIIPILMSAGLACSAQVKPLLEQLKDIAIKDNMQVYNICEIKDGVSRTVSIIPSSNCHNTYSVAKAFVVTAIGILDDRDYFDVDDPLYPFIIDFLPKNHSPNWRKIKISDVMTHRCGFPRGFLDIDAQNATQWSSTDYLSLILQLPIPDNFRDNASYSDGAFYLLSRLVTETIDQKLDDFLAKELLVPLQFREFAFSKCPQGYPIGATGMYITTEDMAKLGQLYLQGGVYNGKRYLSKRFVDKVLARGFEFHGNPKDGYAKGGMAGQYLHFNPRTNRVIAIHSWNADIKKLMECVAKFD